MGKTPEKKFNTTAVGVIGGVGLIAGACIGIATGGIGLVFLGTAIGISGPVAGGAIGGIGATLFAGACEASDPSETVEDETDKKQA